MTGGLALGLAWIGGLAPLVAVLFGAEPARAQLSGSVTLATDYRLRGVSLTDLRPALSLGAAYDDPSGFYAGGAVIGHNPEGHDVRILGHTEYLGFAGRGAGGTSWDVGFANVDMTLYLGRKYPLEYRQVYVGIAKDALSARLSYSPDYPREGVKSLYLDLNGAVRPAENWRLTGHLGAMSRLNGDRAIDGKPTRYDVRLGLARTFDHGELQLAWNAVTPRPRPLTRRTRGGLSLAASYFF